jgi:hypothetical protein
MAQQAATKSRPPPSESAALSHTVNSDMTKTSTGDLDLSAWECYAGPGSLSEPRRSLSSALRTTVLSRCFPSLQVTMRASSPGLLEAGTTATAGASRHRMRFGPAGPASQTWSSMYPDRNNLNSLLLGPEATDTIQRRQHPMRSLCQRHGL